MTLQIILILFMFLNILLSYKIVKSLEVHREAIKDINGVIYRKYFGDDDTDTKD